MRDPRISVRVDQKTKDRLARAVADTGVDESLLVRRCIDAMLDYVEKHGSITFPLTVSPAPVPKVSKGHLYPSHPSDQHLLAAERPPKPKRSAAG